MAGPGLQSSSHLQDSILIIAQGYDLCYLRFAFGERARLVHGDESDLAECFQDRAPLHQHAAFSAGRYSGGDGGRCRNHQRARAADQENGEALVNPFRPWCLPN